MWYNLSNPLERESFTLRTQQLTTDGAAMVELTVKRPRSLRQNAYLHLAISYFALQLGYTAQEVKDAYFKRLCSPDLFLRTRHDPILGCDREYLRSTRSLTKDETTLAINRFLQFAAQHGIYIASPDEYVALQFMQHEVQRNERFL